MTPVDKALLVSAEQILRINGYEAEAGAVGRAGGTNTPDNVRPICNSCNHKRDHGWHGEEIAIKEAEMLRAIQEMLRDSGTESAGLPGYAAGGNGERK